MTDQKPLVRIEGLSKHFGETVALDNLTLDIAQGEFVTFLGPSGCGKSTTLRILGGFERPTHGRVILDGEDVTNQPPEKRHVNMVFQDYALFPHMTVAQNISFGLELKGMGKADIKRRLQEIMAFLELDSYAGRYPVQLSGGQRQRVALARALAPDPALLLLDEPLGALDAKLRGQVQQELKSIQRRTNKTFFFVTHDQEEALTMSDRIVVMNKGRVEQDGTPEELYFRPASRFVAEFIGETNLLSGWMRGTEGDKVVMDWEGTALKGKAPAGIPAEGKPITASVRLEKLGFHADRPQTANAVQGRVVGKTFLGSRMAMQIAVGDKDEPILKAYVDAETGQSVGSDPIWIGWEADHMAVLND
ncbi:MULTISPECIES: ABC transporter ATP-binding protein [Mameliella]|uniref:Spermidine/putrescine import ATP-binding protein PotA n=1 Tax=Mameliella alba TaxID=561184 RepID=A0A0B3S1Y7_9RHOB|nr:MULTISPECIES: ABC transporter ATP-binding protein [Mameliella]MBV6635110.1 ABC transporter ATP-binding protein [Mameliella sp.]MCR9275403.1 ABC transporter ATP-binding protein [Paracoccaceae bacterium]ODM47679.1 spermidine/putrescine ABC transporter ATP-binding protein [Ruegeria sp. PBVC088]KHQ50671.1 ABC transporter ATP-binding protein [Mameliella alba]MDD9732903.1 ABC transporter ATP-binding protein [Mameliella sp. AT18]